MQLAALALLLATPAAAQQPCPAKPVAPPRELAGWEKRVPVTAALTTAALSSAMLRLGQAADVALAPVGTLRFAASPAKAPPPDSRAGLLALMITRPGTYRVALGTGAWTDVLRDGKPVASTAHGHGAQCGDIRKLVDFALTPGRYVIQLSGTAEQKIAVMAVPIG